MSMLRGPEGCPWDKEQTSATIAPYALEEAFEVVEAIDEGDPQKLKEELGDLLLQVVFHAQMANEKREFSIEDVIESINNKLVRRHPHVFAKDENSAKTPDQVLKKWSEIKKEEGRKHLLDGIPKALPALLRATRMGEKAGSVGFDWSHSKGVWTKIEEELAELRRAEKGDGNVEEEMGDLLFALASLSRHLKVDAETSLRKATEKFERRFRQMEEACERRNVEMRALSAAELDDLWNSLKRSEKDRS